MSLFKMIGRKIKQDREDYYAFRTSYTDSQALRLFIMNIFILLYGIWGTFCLVPVFPDDTSRTMITFIIRDIFSVIVLALTIFGLKYKFKSNRAKEILFDVLFSLVALFDTTWALLTTLNSVRAGMKVSLIIWTITLGILYALFYMKFWLALLLYLYSMACIVYWCTGLSIIVLEPSDAMSGSVFAIVFLIAYFTRYKAGLRAYKGRRTAEELREALLVANNEMSSQNDELKRLTDELKKKNEDQRTFTASMNHELRTPLNGIIGSMQVMLQDETLTDEQRGDIERALKSGNILLEIVNNMLDFSKMEAGQFEIVEQNFDLKDVVETTIKTYEPAAKEKGLDYITEISEDTICSLKGDSTRIQQIIMNLVSNAIKYTDTGSVTVSFVVDNEKLIFAVQDTGQGMSEAAKSNLFTPYKRFNVVKNANIQGTGLGLAIVNNLINSMGGSIVVDSEVGKGSKFTVVLPVSIVDDTLRWNSERTVEHVEVRDLNLSGKRILCVDDNKVNLAIFKGLLKNTNAELDLVNSGKAAIEQSVGKKYDIIFMDCMMPEMDGIEAMKRIREVSDINSPTPVIALTANAGPTKEAEYKEIGFQGYLPKPIIREELLSLLSTYIE